VAKKTRKAKTTVFNYKQRSNKFFSHLAAHYRQRDRKSVAIRCEIEIALRNGRHVDSGRASITNLSSTGALLSNFKLHNATMPTKPFRIKLKLLNKEFQGITIICLPVRLEVEKTFSLGVKFQDISVEV